MTKITPASPWWWGHDDERFSGPFDTREAAEEEARESADGGFYICQAEKGPPLKLSDYIDADWLIEHANDKSWDDHGDPDGDHTLFDPSADQIADLQARLRTAADEWQASNGIVIAPFQFAECTVAEWVSIDESGAEE